MKARALSEIIWWFTVLCGVLQFVCGVKVLLERISPTQSFVHATLVLWFALGLQWMGEGVVIIAVLWRRARRTAATAQRCGPS
jgi:uncharacterized membrane protein HdeD (DUF308 family)